MRVGIFGGTFDPIHMGHLLLAQQAMETASLEQVWFIPAGEPPHKQENEITPAQHRLQMVRLAVEGNPRFLVNEMELKREGPSYTVDTIQILKESTPEHDFFLLVGADTVKDLPHWYKIKKILQLVQVIGLGRPGVRAEGLPDFVTDRLQWIPGAIETSISSTAVRQRAKCGKSLRYLVPDPVYQYIKEHRLYGT
ncbi:MULTISPECIES: nicotinate-nucleotide adenylyltransferase [Thermoactinomyces]|jgi:nicotinate-nucleotide adenylyltransferase|uniref:Probable nicotinate-nucleotide adenylyltransferase n=1 Tax=Thermoactinomyces daqus TaxID=1329516 RepID=A0A7W1X9Y5_9BACL|nr:MULTISPECIES: nicotinate-nucleotide adenylyltransferase [Thermoactinomyces]MBA4542678.1 nicotinate-nucleotide adenylyltransferase [Thermoactinomyces daqus]MBH8597342.1 nicotinate-nucleotide adenylyltransferase [Thermoactinomyces sp. CICC 10523]MBH8602903.1 nicotinate-nucleotide adenylyltransferase [Thermoactinomyces sp. CICC 10522]MBH8607249.1 nicotinate-nucleotide adenylyltransferase [Thermoactinomyces sp. CICC 10521]